MEKAIVYDDFKGGIADSYALGAKGQFQDCVNVDFQSEPNGLKLWPRTSSAHTTDAQVTGFVNLAVTWVATGIFAHTANGKIYDTSAGGTNVVTLTANPRIFFIVPRNESGTVWNYVFCEGKIHRANSDFTTITYDYKTFSGQPTSYHNYGSEIFFASSNFIYSLDFAGTLTTEHTFPGWRLPVAMTFFQDTLRVYSNDQQHGWLDVFSITDLSAFQYEVKLDNNPVLGAVNSGSFDYVVAGKVWQGDIYVSSGTQLQLLRSTNEWTASARDFNGKCDARLGDPYFVSTGWTANGIWAFTKGMPGVPQALHRPFDNGSYECSAVHCSQAHVYYGYRDSENQYRVGRFETATPPTYSAEGYVTTVMTDFGDPFEYKRITRIEIAYDCDNSNPFNHGWEVEIYARKDRSDAWTKMADSGTLSDVGEKEWFNFQTEAFGQFHSVEFKILLKSANGTYSPLLKALRVTVSQDE